MKLKIMKKRLTYIISSIAVLLGLVGGVYWLTLPVLGNVSQKLSPCQTATATTSLNHMQAGLATTTLTCDFYSGATNITTAASNPTLADGAYLNFMVAPSSTALSVVNINLLVSENGQDWFHVSTTSPSVGGNIGNIATFTFNQSASTTYDYRAVTAANSATTTRNVEILTPMRYIRAVFTVPVGAQPSAIYAEVVGKKQR